MRRPVLPPGTDAAARFEYDERIGVLLVQQESNSFARQAGTIERFTISSGADAAVQLEAANSEFTGAVDELGRRGATPVPLLSAHALPGGVLSEVSFGDLRELAVDAIRQAGPIDGLVVCLHGALATELDGLGDLRLLRAIRQQVGEIPIALTLDLHANVTAELVALADVITGYRTNPHVDLAETGQRAVALLAATMNGSIVPVAATSTCPAIFPDESLRTPGGLLQHILDDAVTDANPSVIDVSLFPTQPWLDAPGIGFTTVVVSDGDAHAARRLASQISRQVWERRFEFVVDRLLPPGAALERAVASNVRPFVITESADAPTAGATGDGTGMLAALSTWGAGRSALATIVDAPAVDICHTAGVGAHVSTSVGATIDDRWSPPTSLAGEVVSIGDGDYALTGVGYTGLRATMGRFAVVRNGGLRVLITELPAWSADPGTWRHAGVDPYDVDLLVVRSCTDYMANFPLSAPTAVVADVPGPATPRLTRLTFERAGIVPFPVDPDARWGEASDGDGSG